VTHPYPGLHHPVLRRVCSVLWAFYFIHVPGIPVVGLEQLARVKEVMRNLLKDLLTGGLGALDPNQVPPQDADAQLVAEGGLAVVFVGCKDIPLHCHSLLQDAEANPNDCHETVLEETAFLLTVKVNLWWSEVAGAGGGEDWCEKNKGNSHSKSPLMATKLKF
jgi:hypothetical protein